MAEKGTEKGQLADISARILMKLLYGARMARYDLLRAVGALASMITKCDKWQDKKLHRLICYVLLFSQDEDDILD